MTHNKPTKGLFLITSLCMKDNIQTGNERIQIFSLLKLVISKVHVKNHNHTSEILSHQ